jgi:hypothetical protein
MHNINRFIKLYSPYFAKETLTKTMVEQIFNEAGLFFNKEIATNATANEEAFFYLAAHCLSIKLQGNGQNPKFVAQSETLGELSTSYKLPKAIENNSFMAWLATTSFGQRYAALLQSRFSVGVLLCRGR